MLLSIEIQFILSNIVISTLIAAAVLTKKLFKSQLSQRGHYNLWLPVLASFIIPFLPFKADLINLFARFLYIFKTSSSDISYKASASSSDINTAAGLLMEDFAVSIDKNGLSKLPYIIAAVWIIGMLAVLIMIILTNIKIKRILDSSLCVQNKAVLEIFEECKSKAAVKQKIDFKSSAFISSPITFGIIRPKIILPIKLINDFSLEDIGFILLHELLHCKRRDSVINLIMCILQTVYWFNPMIYYMRSKIYIDKELACDASVLNVLSTSQHISYGYTLLNFAEKLTVYKFDIVSGIGGSSSQIKKRINNIISYKPESKKLKFKNNIALLLTISVVLGATPFISVNASLMDNYNFSAHNICYEDMSTYFGGYEGSFVLYDLNDDAWSIYNEKLSTKRVSPNSTYKIYSALFGLEAESVTPECSLIEWDGTINYYDSWNQDHTLETAVQNSVNWYFDILDYRTGMAELKHYINKINYGNEDLSGGLNKYWLESSLKISPIEQVELLKKLYLNEFGFSPENIAAIKNSLLLYEANSNVMYGKTGSGKINGKSINGWFIGFMETPENTFFFAAYIKGDDNASGNKAREIALDILNNKLYLP